jgi:hypothetical protein
MKKTDNKKKKNYYDKQPNQTKRMTEKHLVYWLD